MKDPDPVKTLENSHGQAQAALKAAAAPELKPAIILSLPLFERIILRPSFVFNVSANSNNSDTTNLAKRGDGVSYSNVLFARGESLSLPPATIPGEDATAIIIGISPFARRFEMTLPMWNCGPSCKTTTHAFSFPPYSAGTYTQTFLSVPGKTLEAENLDSIHSPYFTPDFCLESSVRGNIDFSSILTSAVQDKAKVKRKNAAARNFSKHIVFLLIFFR